MIDFITSHPMYVPFLIFNSLIIYEVVRIVRGNNNGKDDDGSDDNDGINLPEDPILDLPPGVTLPVSPKEPVLAE